MSNRVFNYVGSIFHFRWKYWLDHRKRMHNYYTSIVDCATIRRVVVRVGPFYWVRHYVDQGRMEKW